MRVSSAPLLIWAIVALLCTVVLVAEVTLLARVARRAPKNRSLQWPAIASVAIALCSVALATGSWNAFGHFSIVGGCRDVPPGVCAASYEQLAQTIAIITALGWAMVALTVAVALAGAFLLVRAARSR